MQGFNMPPTGFGPGSQPTEEEGAELEFLAMPSGMRTWSLHTPEVEDPEAAAPALALLAELAAACSEAAEGAPPRRFDLAPLSDAARALVLDAMGEGEVSCVLEGGEGAAPLRAQESVFAGVWILRGADLLALEVGPVPQAVAERAFRPRRPALGPLAAPADGVVNAPSIMAELFDHAGRWRDGDAPHVVNLTLLPHTPEDLDHLDAALGEGSARLLSRGYGNCRITAAGLSPVWRVQFFNSMDTLILDTFEVCAMPEAALAASEDFEDSAARLLEVREAMA